MKNFPSFSESHLPADRARFELFLNVFVRCPQPHSNRRVTRRR